MKYKGQHIIRSQTYQIALEKEEGALAFHDRVSNINDLRISSGISKVLDRFDQGDELIQFPKIELNLGLISKDNFEQELEFRIEEELIYFLEHNLQWARSYENYDETTGKDAPPEFTKLSFYLRKGYVKWNTLNNEKPADWLLEVVSANTELNRNQFLALGKDEQVRKRLIFQFKDPELEKLSVFLDPNNGTFIVEFKQNIVHRQEKHNLISVTSRDFRNSVWEIILEYLFVQTGSYSNRKALLKHLLEKIAQRHSIKYVSLLNTMIESIDSLPLNLKGETEFFKILIELGKEYKKSNAQNADFGAAEMAFEEKLRYFFTHGSLPLGVDTAIEPYLRSFLKNKTNEARIFFRNLLKSNPKAWEIMLELISTDLIVEIINIVEIDSLRKLLHLFQTLFENRAESHLFSDDILSLIRTKKIEILLLAFMQHEPNNRQLLFNLLMTIKLVAKVSNRDFLTVLNGAQQILPSGFVAELDQLRQFIVLPLQSTTELSAAESEILLDNSPVPEKPQAELEARESSDLKLQELLLEWSDFVQSTNEMNVQSEFLLARLRKFSLAHKIPISQLLLQVEELLRHLFNDLIPNWELIIEQIGHKVSNDYQSKIPEIWSEGMQQMLSFIRELLKRSFDGTESTLEFIQQLEDYAKKWKLQNNELLSLLRQFAMKELYPEKERINLFFDVVENKLFDFNAAPTLSRQLHMNVMESRHHQLRKIVFDLQNMLQTEGSERKFEMRLFDLIVSLSRQLNLSRLAVVQQLQNTLSWAIPEGNTELEEQLQLAEEQFRKQVKGSRFTADLMHFYLSEKALPWWASTLNYDELKRHASLYVSLFPKEIEKLHKQSQKARSLFDLIDLQAQKRLVQSVWKQVPRKFHSFHLQLEELIIRHFGGVRLSFDELLTRWHFQLWRELSSYKKEVELSRFSDFYMDVMHKELGIEPGELMQLIAYQQSHPYFERAPVKKIVQEVFSRQQKTNPINILDLETNDLNEKEGRITLKEIIHQAEIHKPVREDDLMSQLQKLIERSAEQFRNQLLHEELRTVVLGHLSEKNREKLAYLSLLTEKRNELELSLKLTQYLKSYMTSTQYQKFIDSFYELYFLKLGTDKPVNWKLKDWSWLVYQSLRKTFRQEKVDLLIGELQHSSNIPSPQNQMRKLLQLLQSFRQNKEIPIKKANTLVLPEKENKEQLVKEMEEIFLDIAGLVLIGPYIPRLFEMLGYMNSGEFHDEEAREKAIYALYYVASGSWEPEESELILPKLICGLEIETPVSPPEEPTAEQIEIIESLLKAVIEQWKALKQTSIAGLRETFLQRKGKLSEGEHHYTLQIKQMTLDILLDQLPWTISKLKLSWMTKLIVVEWR